MYEQNSDYYESSETSESGYDSDNSKCIQTTQKVQVL